MWGLSLLEHAANDLRFAIRRLRTRFSFSLAVVAVTALGIGATTAVFSAIDAALIRPLPFVHPSELFVLKANVPFDPGMAMARPRRSFDVRDAAAMTDVFKQVAVYAAGGGMNLTDAENPQRMNAAVVSHDFFATLADRIFDTWSDPAGLGPPISSVSTAPG